MNTMYHVKYDLIEIAAFRSEEQALRYCDRMEREQKLEQARLEWRKVDDSEFRNEWVNPAFR